MKYLLPIIILLSIRCSRSSYSVHEQNMVTQNRRLTDFDQKSRDTQQHIRSSNKSKNKKVKKARKTKTYIR